MEGRTHRILVVDDDPSTLKVTTKILERLGYNVIGHESPKKALEILESFPNQFNLLISDYRMPVMNGAELCQRAKEIVPDLPVVLCSGYASSFDPAEAEQAGIDKFVRKPLLTAEFAELVKSFLEE